jgi:nucleoside-diphosphate-sugar epimerase
MTDQSILVTGGAGMIGSNLVKRLAGQGHRVVVVDNLWRGRKKYLEDAQGRPVIDMAHDFHARDLAVPNALGDLLDGVSIVYHLADIVAGIGYVFSNEGAIFRQNLLINSNVVAACRDAGLEGFIYVGTACSFPAHLQRGVEAAPLRECDQYPAAPESAYGWSKLMGEYEALLMETEARVPVSVLSLHNVYGAPCDFGPERSQVIPSLVRKAINFPDEPFVVWGTGGQGRAFVHVDDVVDALVAARTRGLGKGVIQIGPDRCTSIREIAETVVSVSGKDIEIVYDTTKPEGDKGRCADYAKAREVFGWRPRRSLRAGLEQLYGWMADRIGRAEATRPSVPSAGAGRAAWR